MALAISGERNKDEQHPIANWASNGRWPRQYFANGEEFEKMLEKGRLRLGAARTQLQILQHRARRTKASRNYESRRVPITTNRNMRPLLLLRACR